jgi:hypothetical protein
MTVDAIGQRIVLWIAERSDLPSAVIERVLALQADYWIAHQDELAGLLQCERCARETEDGPDI